jgi:predicted ATPase
MITGIEIDGFKSFKDFKMDFTSLTVVAGRNASGKSNLFDALKLLSRLAEVDLKTAFGEQRGDAGELFLKYDDDAAADTVSFAVEILVDKKVRDNWGGEADLKYTRLRYEIKITRRLNEKGFEELFVTHESLVSLKRDKDRWSEMMIDKSRLKEWIPTADAEEQAFSFIETDKTDNCFVIKDIPWNTRYSAAEVKQSILSRFINVDFEHIFAAREEMRHWRFLQFNPEDLREPTRQRPNTGDTISHSGKNLAAALFRVKQDNAYNLVEISRRLVQFLPEFTEVNVMDDKANKQFIIKLKGEDGREFSSRVLSEGTLRLLALCILLYDEQHRGLLCFEEPENGVYPERMKDMFDLLKDLSTEFQGEFDVARQVIVNSHSPVLLAEALKRKNDKYVSVWFSRMNTLITGFNNRRYKIQITKIIPVIKESQTFINEFSDTEKKLILMEEKKFLDSADFLSDKNSI